MKSIKKASLILSLALFFIFPHLSFATSWNLVVQDGFARSDTSTGSAASTTGVGNGWIDTAGGVWNISGGLLQGTSSASSDYLTKFLLRPSSEDSRDEREVATIPAGENLDGEYLGMALRHQTSTNNYYLAHISSSGIYLYKIVAAATTLISHDTLTLNTSDSYSIDFSAVGVNSTALSVVATDLTTSTVVGTISTTDSEASLQGSGSMGLTTWYNSGSHFIHASQVQTYSTNLVLTGSGSFSGASGSPVAITDLQITGSPSATTPVKLLVTNGTLAMSTTTGLSFTGSPTGAALYFSGTVANINAALATLTYTRSGAGTDTLEISLVNPGEVFFPDNGHLYKFITGSIDWNAAEPAAASLTAYGVSGYLATITSSAENAFISPRLSADGWIGASDNAQEGHWTWVTGPETGTLFWLGESGGSVQSGQYANWNSGEPNNSGGDENCAEYYSASSKWNDLPCSGDDLSGYVAEFGSPGNLPSVASKDISLTTSASYTLTYGAGSHGSLTGTTSQTVLSGNNGTAVTAVPAAGYTFINWSDSSTQNPRTDLSVGGNITVTANFADVTNPTTPAAPTTASPTNNTLPTWTWPASTDLGSGIHYYLVAWSQNADCSGFGNSVTATSAPSYTLTHFNELADGTWYFCAAARDNAGNTSAFSPAGSVLIDTVAPTLSVTSPISGNIPTTTDPVYGFSTNEVGTYSFVSCSSPNPVIDATAGTVTFSGLTAGLSYSCSFHSTDAAGNVSNTLVIGPFTAVIPTSSHVVIVTPMAVPAASGPSHVPLAFTVNSGAPTAHSPTLALSLNADPLTVKGYEISLDPTFAGESIRPYAPTASFTLPSVSGSYTLYLKYYSTSGMWSDVLTQKIAYSSAAATMASSNGSSYKRDLSTGMSGADVTQLQTFLAAKGTGPAAKALAAAGMTGYFGSLTKAAVAEYQKANLIWPVSGYFGPKTRSLVTQ